MPRQPAACRLLLDRGHDGSVEGAVRNCLAQALLAQGRESDIARELGPARESPELAGAERSTVQGWAGFARLALGDFDGASVAAGEARLAAASAGDHVTVSAAMATLAVVSEFRGHLQDALEISDDAARMADLSPGRQGHRYPIHVPRGYILVELGRLGEARSALDTGRRISEELGGRCLRAPGQRGPRPPASRSGHRPAMSGWTQPATSPAPRPPCAPPTSIAAAAEHGSGRGPAGRASLRPSA
jgi:hypothetical protein